MRSNPLQAWALASDPGRERRELFAFLADRFGYASRPGPRLLAHVRRVETPDGSTVGARLDLLLCVADLCERPSAQGEATRFGRPGALLFQAPTHAPARRGRPTRRSTNALLRDMHAGIDARLRELHPDETASARRTHRTFAAYLWLDGPAGRLLADTADALAKKLKKFTAKKPARRR
jgi:hypothetical protein